MPGSRKRELEPITLGVVVPAKEIHMTIENDALCEVLRAWMKSPAIGLQEYSADPVVLRRVGKIIANLGAKYSVHVVNSAQTRLLAEPYGFELPPTTIQLIPHRPGV
jgi:hypothetical protein